MEPPLVPQKKVKKLKLKKNPGTPFIVNEIEPDQSERDKGDDGSDDCECLDEGFTVRPNETYDSIGTLKLDSGKGLIFIF